MNTATSARAIEATSGNAGMIPLFDGGEPYAWRILVKFTFANAKLIPVGVPEQDRGSDAEVDARHAAVAARAGEGSLGAKGRVRDGRVDTGEQVINDNSGSTAGFLRRGIANYGYKLTRVNWYERLEKTGQKKYTVVVQYDQENEPLEQLWLGAALHSLAAMRWDWCNVWDNPDSTITCNFSGRANSEKPPIFQLGVKNKTLMLLPA